MASIYMARICSREVGECSKTKEEENSKTLEVSKSSSDGTESVQVESTSFHDRDCESSPKGDEYYKGRAKERSPRHSNTRDNPSRYNKSLYSNVPFDYKQIDHVKQSLWHMKPCTFCGKNNHVVAKCWKRMVV
jgi:hypothetical protein